MAENLLDIEDTVTGADLIDAALEQVKEPNVYSEGIDGVYRMESDTTEVEVSICRSPLMINADTFYVSLSHIIEINGKHFRVGWCKVESYFEREPKRYMIVSRFWPEKQ